MGFLRQGVAKEALSSHPAFLAPPGELAPFTVRESRGFVTGLHRWPRRLPWSLT